MISKKIDELLNDIFKNYDLELLSVHEKRTIIFKYLSDTLQYDDELLIQIKNKTAKRNHKNEILSVLENKKGICNAISQVYMLLLKKVGIESVCICCDDSTEVIHQLNLVKEGNEYTFDDITYAIFCDNKFERFNYDIKTALDFGHGKRAILDDAHWVIIPPEFIYLAIKEDLSSINDISDFEIFVNELNKNISNKAY